jgi:putative transposase
MPRQARTVFAGVPHHITQRGNRREDVFYTDEDRETYLGWLNEYCQLHKVEILAYCLMTNHIHIIALPKTDAGLQLVFKPLHMRYAQRFNSQRGWKGHVWQGRYFSSALDEHYLWSAIRYVERNPVRAKMLKKAENYAWSSAAAHCEGYAGDVLTTKAYWKKQFESIGNWSAWLAEVDSVDELLIIHRNIEKGLPCGSDRLIQKLEKKIGRMLKYLLLGRSRKPVDS